MLRMLACMILVLLSFCACERTGTLVKRSPITRVIVVVGDDHSFRALGCYGNSYIRTPNLDRLASMGLRFERAYSTSPICSASRQSLLTGKYPHATGVNQLFTPFPDEPNITIAEHLQGFGFRTALIGKSHFNNWLWAPLYENGLPNHGFELMLDRTEHREWVGSQGTLHLPEDLLTRDTQRGEGIAWAKNAQMLPVGSDIAHSEAQFFVNESLQFLDNDTTPALLWLAFHEPHAPFAYPIEYQSWYAPDSVPLPLGSPEDERWLPEIFRGLTESERRGIVTSYYRSVSHLDHQVGRLLDSLAAEGTLDQTLIVYLGDQGYLLNEHCRFEKHSFWEEAVRAPLIMAGPGLPAGMVIREPVSFLDLAPTLCDVMGLPPHPDFQGRSLRRYWDRHSGQPDSLVYSVYLLDNKAMVTDGRWKYIFTSGTRDQTLSYATGLGPSGLYHRLYDLANDSLETTNLAYEPGQATRVIRLQQALRDEFARTHPEADQCPADLNLLGQLVWYCEPRDLGADYREVPARIFLAEPYDPASADALTR